MFAINPLVLLLASSLVSAASTPVARVTGTFPVCAICPSVDTAGNAVGANAGFGLTPPERFCGYVCSIRLVDEGLEGLYVATVTLERTGSSLDASTMFVFCFNFGSASDSYSNDRIPALSLWEQNSVLLRPFQLMRRRTARWLQRTARRLQTKGLSPLILLSETITVLQTAGCPFGILVVVGIDLLMNINLYAP